MTERPDTWPETNAPEHTTPTGGAPARPSNAVLMKSRGRVERYSGGTPLHEKLSAFIVDDAVQRVAADLQKRAYALLRFPTGPLEAQLTKQAGTTNEPAIDDHDSAPTDKMRPRAELILYNRDGVFAADRGDYILFPGGGIDDGEQPRDAAIRETLEEANRHPINVVNAGVVESVWPLDSGNAFWDDSDFDGERTYFFSGVDAGEAGITHEDREEFEVIPFDTLITRLTELRDRSDQTWARRNNDVRLKLVRHAKRLAASSSNLRPIKQAGVAEDALAAAAPPAAPTGPAPVPTHPTAADVAPTTQNPAPPAESGQPAPQTNKDFVAGLAQKFQPVEEPAQPGAPAEPANAPAGATAPQGAIAPEGATAPATKTADAANLMRRNQYIMLTPDGRVIVRRIPNRRFSFPEQGVGKRAPYEEPVRLLPPTGVPEPGYHGYEVGLHVGDAPEAVPEGFEAVPAEDALRELYASMGLAANRPFQALDRARARALVRLLKKRRKPATPVAQVPGVIGAPL